MSKLLRSGVAVVVAFGLAAPAFAAVDCTTDPSIPVCHQGNGNPGLIMNAWGLTGDQTPKFAPGASVDDGYGHTLTCPWWFPPAGCFDITKTAFYRTTVLGIR